MDLEASIAILDSSFSTFVSKYWIPPFLKKFDSATTKPRVETLGFVVSYIYIYIYIYHGCGHGYIYYGYIYPAISQSRKQSTCKLCGRVFKNSLGVLIHRGRMHKSSSSATSVPVTR